MSATKTRKTFQQENRKIFLCATIGGLYPPGIEDIIKSPTVLKIASYFPLVTIMMASVYFYGLVDKIINDPPESQTHFIHVIRRTVIIAYTASMPASHFFRRKKMEDLYYRWNNGINNYYPEKRKVIFEKKMHTSKVTLLVFIGVRFTLAQLYNIPFMLNRYAPGSELVGLPHDNKSPYHFNYVAFQFIYFIYNGTSNGAFEFLVCSMMTMAETELEFLKERLHEILSIITIRTNGQVTIQTSDGGAVEATIGDELYTTGVNRVEKELKRWVEAHQETIRWIQDLTNFTHLLISIKYIYLIIHCSLVVIGLMAKISTNELFLILAVTGGNFGICFYGTRQADRIFEKSQEIFADAYSDGWYLFPKKLQKVITIIATTNCQPIVFMGLKAYQDSSSHFSNVLQTAYNVLTFILPMMKS